MAAEMQWRGAGMRLRFVAPFFAADQAIDQYDALAAVGFLQRLPPGTLDRGVCRCFSRASAGIPRAKRTAHTRFTAARLFVSESEVLEERDAIVLAAGSAGGDGKVRMGLPLFFPVFKGGLVFRREPQLGAGCRFRE